MVTDPRVDAYIANSAAFAQPILENLRATVRAACPDVQETIKWGMPFFEHGGRPPGQQREYVEWITEAKREDTRARRVAQAIEWLAEGKSKNWKYERC
jgi:Bacteriocin-protection, YdeI or OmpD-Associated/Domain of unknown function (DU1801)